MKTYLYSNFKRHYGLPVTVRDTVQSELVEPHVHDYIEIAMVYHGKGLHLIHSHHGETLPNAIIKGDIFTVLPGEIHSYENCFNCRVYNICIQLDVLAKFREQLADLEYFNAFFNPGRPFRINQLQLSPGEFKNAENILHELLLCITGSRPSRQFALQVKLLNFLLAIFDGGLKGLKSTGTSVNEKLFQSIAKLEARPEQRWNISRSAREAGMSISGYAHKFKEAVGVPPGEYALLLKLDKAKSLLAKSDMSLDEIAIQCALCDGNYMIRAFKKRFGITPGRYRISCRGQKE